MNRHNLQKIILEELSSERHVRPRRRVLGLVDYLYESSDQNLLKIRELSNDWAVREKPRQNAVPTPTATPPVEADGPKAPAPTAAPGAPVASPEASAPNVPVKDQSTASEPPAGDTASVTTPNEDEVDSDEERAAAAEKARNAADEREIEIENLRNRDSDGPGDVVTAPAPGEVPPPTLSLSDTIDDKIEKAARAAEEASGTPASTTVAEGAYWRRGLVDLLYSN